MVFFTCNKCGDSLKKKDVVKHVGKCHGQLALTCVDCHKDFYGDEYIAHTSCITEAEKYGVKGFKSRAPSTAGASKQEEWMQAVLSASKIPGLTSHQRSFLTALNRHGNVPRKQKQFQNFAHNVWRESFRLPNEVEQVFGMIELELKKIKGPLIENGSTQDNSSKGNDVGLEKNTGDVAVEVITTKKSAEKKEEKSMVESKVNGRGKEEETLNVITEENTSKKSKTKKHKKREEEGTEAVVGESTVEENTTKKSKKKKHRRQEEEALAGSKQNGVGTEENAVEAQVEDTTCSKKNKKKHKKQEKEAVEEKIGVNEEQETTVDIVMEDATNKKRKKNKRKMQEGETVDETKENGNEAEEEAEVTTGEKIKKKKHRQVEEEKVPRKKSKKSKQT